MARKARGSWLSLKRSIEAEMRAEELKEPLRNFQKDIKTTVDDLRTGVESGVGAFKESSAAKTESGKEPAKSDDGD
jgi:hypothetical protein